MTPRTTYPARRDDVRLLVVDGVTGIQVETRSPDLVTFLDKHDLLVVNDAATLPASLLGQDEHGNQVELRLAAHAPPGREQAAESAVVAAGAEEGIDDQLADTFQAVLFGAGDWRQRTEDRPAPPVLGPGARLHFGRDLHAEVVARSSLSPRLLTVRFIPLATQDALWSALYRHARPIQYSYLAHALPLWAVQTVYAARPWAFEMPSAGRPLSWEILLALKRKGVALASLTHAAGLSSTGDPAIDAALPLPERFELTADTVRSVEQARARGGRVIAVGTSVVRALEGAVAARGTLGAGGGVTTLRIDRHHHRRVVDGLITGIHSAGESHFDLLGAFASPGVLAAASAHAQKHGFAAHELGDLMLIIVGDRDNKTAVD